MSGEDNDMTATKDEFVRLPGLFRRWEFEQVIDAGAEFVVEEAGTASDGTPLVAVYRRDRPVHDEGRKKTL